MPSILDQFLDLFEKGPEHHAELPIPHPDPTPEEARARFLEIAAHYVGVKEVGANAGPEVQQFQLAVDGKAQGESWCMAFMQFCMKSVEKETGLPSKIFSSEHCMTVWNKTPTEARVAVPQPGDIVIWTHVGTTNGHTGVVEKVNNAVDFNTIEGNTGDGEGVVRDGDGVYRRVRRFAPKGSMQVKGFLRPF